jgi:hypothetical protein
MMDVEGYGPLRDALQEAYDQSARGKGVDRHANGRDFDRQPIMEIGRMVGPGFQLGQAIKKLQEAAGMISRGEGGAAVRELLGAIVYSAAAVNLVREMEPPTYPPFTTEELDRAVANVTPHDTPFLRQAAAVEAPGINDDPMAFPREQYLEAARRAREMTLSNGVQGS